MPSGFTGSSITAATTTSPVTTWSSSARRAATLVAEQTRVLMPQEDEAPSPLVSVACVRVEVRRPARRASVYLQERQSD